ncbi:MAG: WG repeat-containing protein [Tannerella sp.]|jgi:hypothetical protein|nr:WG repeat-containing protein [Tannerella sp.]
MKRYVRPFQKQDKSAKTGTEVIPLKYDATGSFSEGLARVRLNGKRFYIDRAGRWVKDCS